MNKSSELLSERFCEQRSGRCCDSSARYYPKPPESRPPTCSQSILLVLHPVKPLRNRYSPWMMPTEPAIPRSLALRFQAEQPIARKVRAFRWSAVRSNDIRLHSW